MRLIVKSGNAAGEEFEVDRELIAGRAATADIVIADAGISSRHARLRPATGGIEVTDLGSTNGTFVDGTKISDATVVRPGSELRFSTTPLEVAPSIRIGRSSTAGGSGMPRLVVRTGADKGRETVLTEGVDIIIGRGTAANLQLSDSRVSERNTRVRLTGGNIEVVDLGSANGTLVDGQPVVDSARVPEGAEIQVGDTVVSYTRQAAAELDAGPMPTVIGRRPGLSDSVIGKRVEAAVAATEKQRGRRMTFVMSAVGILAAGAVGVGAWALLRPGPDTTDPTPGIVRDNTPAVVRILVTDSDGNQGAGSGSIIDLDKGLILTNNHVIARGKAVVYNDLIRTPLEAVLVGTAFCDDLAVIRVPNLKDKVPGLKQVKFGDPNKLVQGEHVVTLGYPGADEKFEDVKLSTTSGIISKTKTVFENDNDTPHHQNVIQTDAAINHGNSGGPMFNMRGEQIGVNALGSAKRGSSGQNYAISVGRVLEVLPTIKGGTSPKWIGAYFSTYSDKNKQPVYIGIDTTYPGGAADRAKLVGATPDGDDRQGVTKINGKEVKTVPDYCSLMPDTGTVTLTILDRNTGKMNEVQVPVGQN